MTAILKNFLEIPYDELEELNQAAAERAAVKSEEELQGYYIKYLKGEKRLKAVTVCFTDMEGRFHMLDYDKKYLLDSFDNFTFDGSSIKGFSEVRESDLRLRIDWGSFRWLPSDVFGPGKVIVFGFVENLNGDPYGSDFRIMLKNYVQQMEKNSGITPQVSVECEGFLFRGLNAEQNYNSRDGFEMVSSGGYFNSLPKDELKIFIDNLAEAQRALHFQNEKDHPEVAPSQFELNYKYTDPVRAADQLQLYKLTARQVAANAGLTACFLPKPVAGINGNGMHTNLSMQKKGKNIFYDAKGETGISKTAWDFIDRVLYNANDLCLIMNSSVNSYRRLDPAFEAPNQIKASGVDRTSMIRIPAGNEKSARIEMRSVSPDSNPYLAFYALIRTGLEGETENPDENKRPRTRLLPGNIYDAVARFKGSELMAEIMGADAKDKFLRCKLDQAHRCPRELGSIVKTGEIVFHHEVTNQYIWSRF